MLPILDIGEGLILCGTPQLPNCIVKPYIHRSNINDCRYNKMIDQPSKKTSRGTIDFWDEWDKSKEIKRK